MKIASFTYQDHTRIGVVIGDEIVDLSKALPSLPTDMITFIEQGDSAIEAASQAAGNGSHRKS